MVGGAASDGRPQVTQEGRVGRALEGGKRGPGGEEKLWNDCVAEIRRVFDIKGD